MYIKNVTFVVVYCHNNMSEIHFYIEYKAPSPQCLFLAVEQDGAEEDCLCRYKMSSTDGTLWTVSLPSRSVKEVSWLRFWFYVFAPCVGCVREEWHRVPHKVRIDSMIEHSQHVHCRWMDTPDDDFLYTLMFRKDASWEPTAVPSYAGDMLQVRCPHLKQDERLFLTGQAAVLGAWNLSCALPLSQTDEGRWVLPLGNDWITKGEAEAKFVAMMVGSDGTPLAATARWEDGCNRTLPATVAPDGCTHVWELPVPRLPFAHPRLTGTLVPVFSLRSEGSAGVGDFGDLYRFVEWAAHTGQNLVQLLPINDTTTDGTWRDSYPYSSVSVFALHPMYIDLRQLPALELSEEQLRNIEQERLQLENLKQADYERVNVFKDKVVRLSFKQQWNKTSRTARFRRWMKESAAWLVPYSAYRQHAADYGTARFEEWGSHSRWNEKERCKWSVIHRERAEPHYYFFYQQWLLHEQLMRVCSHARELNLHLKCDIGIGVNAMACDVWQNPGLFHRNMQAGAPPDYFSHKGQNWGFPTYNWAEMSREDYSWWTMRLQHMQRYFDAFRLDHVLGFFRIWEIPHPHSDGRKGHFYPALPLTESIPGHLQPLFMPYPHPPGGCHPCISARQTEQYQSLSDADKRWFDTIYDHFFFHRHNQLWYDEAMRKLSVLLNRTSMLPCAEDLGMLNDAVPILMSQLKILSLEMQTMPKCAEHGEFADASSFPRNSVCMTSTHDTPPLRLWWEEDAERAQRYAGHVLHIHGEAPTRLTPGIAEAIICQYLRSESMLCVLPIQDWLTLDEALYRDNPAEERVNDPSNPQHYWQYRMHITIEQLQCAACLNDKIRQLATREHNVQAHYKPR